LLCGQLLNLYTRWMYVCCVSQSLNISGSTKKNLRALPANKIPWKFNIQLRCKTKYPTAWLHDWMTKKFWVYIYHFKIYKDSPYRRNTVPQNLSFELLQLLKYL
jgi:hypothetical protein